MLLLCRSALAQGFVNLDFESADLSAYGAGPAQVPIADAIPGWTGYLGNNLQTSVLYNSLDIGSANLAILGTNNSLGIGTIPGNSYTVVLQAGASGQDGVSAAIAQTALIPATAKSILFTANNPNFGWQVSIAGQNIPVSQVSTVGNYYAVWAGDISAYAGQKDELRFTALFGAGPSVNLYLDSISFSSSSVPEPSEFALTALGALLLGFRRRRNHSP